jgi:hypothetical protein
MGSENSDRPSLGRIVWLREELAKGSTPGNAHAELVGTYDPLVHQVTISFVLTLEGTEYRVIRYHKIIIAETAERLRQLHRNMVAYAIKQYSNIAWSKLVDKFLHWSTNPVHAAVFLKYR